MKKVSEWVAAGGLKSGLQLVESKIVEIREKSIGCAVKRFTAYGNLKDDICWFPKSKCQQVENDYYQQGAKVMLLVPGWLCNVRRVEGYDL